MAALRVLLCLLALATVRGVAETNAHDIEFSKTITFEIKGDQKHGYELKSHVEIEQTFLSDRSTDSTTFVIHEQAYERVSDIEARLDDKKISGNHIIPAHLVSRDVFLSDDDVWIIDLPRKARPGQTLRYSYKKKYVDIAYLPLVLVPNVDYIKSYTVVVKHPESVAVNFEFFFPTGDLKYRIDSTNEKETSLTFAATRAAKRMSYFPFNSYRAAVMVSLTQDSTAINPTPLSSFVDWYSDQLPEVHPGLAEQKALLLDERLDSADGVIRKLDVINDFVTGNIRYIADSRFPNGLIPHEPLSVLNRRYGDCKDRAYLVQALAGLAGIKVNMAAISTEPRPYFTGVHWSLYNHVVCVYSEGDSSVFFDPTARTCELGDIPEYLIEQPALVLDTADPRILLVPLADTLPAVSVTIDASADSLADARATIVLRKDYLMQARYAKDDLSPDEFKRHMANHLGAAFYKVTLDQLDLVSESKHSAVYSARADLSKFIITTESSLYAPRCAFAGIDRTILDRSNDALPLYFEQTDHAALDILLRQVAPLSQADSTVLEGSGAGTFSAVASPVDSGAVMLAYEFRRPYRILRGEDKANFIRFVEDYLKTKNDMFIFHGRQR